MDLEKHSLVELKQIAEEKGDILFIGTKKQAQEAVETEAKRCECHYINQRWLGGTLTNFTTISKRIQRLHELNAMEERMATLRPASSPSISAVGSASAYPSSVASASASENSMPSCVIFVRIKFVVPLTIPITSVR